MEFQCHQNYSASTASIIQPTHAGLCLLCSSPACLSVVCAGLSVCLYATKTRLLLGQQQRLDQHPLTRSIVGLLLHRLQSCLGVWLRAWAW